MSPTARYWTLHWLRVLLWPLPVLSLLRVGRSTAGTIRSRYARSLRGPHP